MANKKRKYVQPAAKPKRSHTPRLVNTDYQTQVASSTESKQATMPKPSVPTEGPDVRYQYIANEIKRILITAGIIFGIMIILWLILK